MCKHWVCIPEEPDQDTILFCNENMSEKFRSTLNQWGPMSAVRRPILDLWSHSDHEEKTSGCASWVNTTGSAPIQSDSRGVGVSTGCWAVWPMAEPRDGGGIELQRLKQGRWRRGGDSVVSLNSCIAWLTGEELPANSPHCFCILFPFTKCQRQLSFYYDHVCAQRGCCKWRQSAS